jgi:hypothetical protein
VVDGKTGVFFDHPNSRAMSEAIEMFESMVWSQILLRRHAEKFDNNVFAFACCSSSEASRPVRARMSCWVPRDSYRKTFPTSVAKTCRRRLISYD